LHRTLAILTGSWKVLEWPAAIRKPAMGSFKHPRAFLPLDLQVVEMVCDAAWTQIADRDPFRDTTFDEDRKGALRRTVFALAHNVPVDYETLLNRVMSNVPKACALFVAVERSPKPGGR
jgi:hypothetical protein